MGYKNKIDQARSAAKHYEDNKELIKQRAVEFKQVARKRNRAFVNTYLSEHPCIDCGETEIIVLEFDHINSNKILEISTALNAPWSLKRLQSEIDKCVVRCANCHRRITHKRRKEKV